MWEKKNNAMPCPSTGPKQFETIQLALYGSKFFGPKCFEPVFYVYFGPFQSCLDRPKQIASVQNRFGHVEGQGINFYIMRKQIPDTPPRPSEISEKNVST